MARVDYLFPVREGNQFDLIVDGDACFNAMLDAIGSARQCILIEQYLVESGWVVSGLVDALGKAACRGITVYMLLDDFGSSGLRLSDRSRLEDAGVRLRFYNPVHFRHWFNNLFRDHRKLLVVDGELGFVGGAGLADAFSQERSGALAWKDVMLKIRGRVVRDWCELFSWTWKETTTEDVVLPEWPANESPGYQSGRVLVSAPFHRLEISRALIRQMRKAKQRIWITSPYFVTSRKIRRILGQAAFRGVDVRLLLPGVKSDHPWVTFASRRHYGGLLAEGIRIFEYQPRFTHAKIELCDHWVSIGSSNLDRWNQSWNLDANQTVIDEEFAHRVAAFFVQDFSDSREITTLFWKERSFASRLGEALSGVLVNGLQHLIRRRRP
ncbi:MAG: phospholipase D-like domain-containing protein [Gammaproteobacteria bacterium]|nr:phospholipase D-like domain-containing protein [Gammaproteobacteria bacterium]